ncbi:MAG: DNA modification methylase [Bacteroidales bacterium]|jgi:DNA modification methylase|nr:DNA modification methylase [Bacteroidales bacterium]
MAEKKIIKAKIDQLIPDDVNFNKGTEYGQSLIEKSLRQFGAGRSILLDKNNKIIAGNKTVVNAEHPTMKPVKLVGRLIRNSSKVNDLIIDFFLGSGTTLIASHQLERNCYGLEISPKYCQVIIDRIKLFDPEVEVTKL